MEHYGTLQSIKKPLWNIMELELLQNVAEHYRTVTERYRSVAEVSWGVVEHYGTLQSIAGRYTRIPAKARFGRPYCPINLIITLSPSLIDF